MTHKLVGKISWVVFISLGIGLSGCDDNEEEDLTPAPPVIAEGPTQTLAEIVIMNEHTDSLLLALQHTGMVSTFQGSSKLTLFAPTNSAFAALIASDTVGWNRITDVPVQVLTQLLMYHVTTGQLMTADMRDDQYIPTLNDNSPNRNNTVIEMDTEAGVWLNNRARITHSNVEATNGVIHMIDSVLMPQNVVQLGLADERFNMLVSAVSLFGDTLTDVLSAKTAGGITVFAPVDSAFQAFLNANSYTSLQDIPRNTLKSILEYHILSGTNARAAELTQDKMLNTLNGNSLQVDRNNGIQLVTGNSMQGNVDIIAFNIQGTNGVIHAVDQLLLPN
jgi:uncharacterized surface protein with fasciclin (FAS1) repeats